MSSPPALSPEQEQGDIGLDGMELNTEAIDAEPSAASSIPTTSDRPEYSARDDLLRPDTFGIGESEDEGSAEDTPSKSAPLGQGMDTRSEVSYQLENGLASPVYGVSEDDDSIHQSHEDVPAEGAHLAASESLESMEISSDGPAAEPEGPVEENLVASESLEDMEISFGTFGGSESEDSDEGDLAASESLEDMQISSDAPNGVEYEAPSQTPAQYTAEHAEADTTSAVSKSPDLGSTRILTDNGKSAMQAEDATEDSPSAHADNRAEVHAESLRNSPTAAAAMDNIGPVKPVHRRDGYASSHTPSETSPLSPVRYRSEVVSKRSQYSRESGCFSRAFRQLPAGSSRTQVIPSESPLKGALVDSSASPQEGSGSPSQQAAEDLPSPVYPPSDASEERVEDLLESEDPESTPSQQDASRSVDRRTPVAGAAENAIARFRSVVPDALQNGLGLPDDMSDMHLPFVTALRSYTENGKPVYDLTWDTEDEGNSDSEGAMASSMELADFLPDYQSDHAAVRVRDKTYG
ncbi:hypothetical protein OE88DRAFT_1191661 [Heliocybe sulcata]|uniref:Uncharacterized protein n=1 Tax=Heliocybe sulcata TaxID=5364 RepID=A0A5C3NL98_9AGAM|nr:hypothetical protein OE88DRAFT_1191661 [Heliocybe sulcata]